MAKCLQILKVCKTAGERQDYAFDLTAEFAILWQPNYPYPIGAISRPNTNPARGLEHVSSGGVSDGELEPDWPGEVGDVVDDGSIINWTAQALTYAGLRHRIVTVAWTGPVGISFSDQVETDHPAMQEVRIWVSGGTRGKTYTIVGLIETNIDAIFEVRLEIKIE